MSGISKELNDKIEREFKLIAHFNQFENEGIKISFFSMNKHALNDKSYSITSKVIDSSIEVNINEITRFYNRLYSSNQYNHWSKEDFIKDQNDFLNQLGQDILEEYKFIIIPIRSSLKKAFEPDITNRIKAIIIHLLNSVDKEKYPLNDFRAIYGHGVYIKNLEITPGSTSFKGITKSEYSEAIKNLTFYTSDASLIENARKVALNNMDNNINHIG